MKNIRKFATVFILLTASFLICFSSFAASGDDFDFTDPVSQRTLKRLFRRFLPEKVVQGAADIALIYDDQGYGTGFVVRDKKRNRFLLLTAWHVVEEGFKKSLHIKIKHKGGELKIKEIIAYSEKYDVFIGVLESYKGSGLTLADSPNYNSDMYILGFPHGQFTVKEGDGIDIPEDPYFRIVIISAKSLEGSSGGPVLNDEGEVTGMYQAGDWINIVYVLKSESFKDLLFGINTSQAKWREAGFIVVEKPFEEAVKYIKARENRGELSVWKEQVEIKEKSELLLKDSLPRLREIAEKGSSTAQLRLSLLLEDSGVKEQQEEAIHYLKLTAQQGNIKAMFLLGEKLYKGNGVPQDKSAAAHWFQSVTKNRAFNMLVDRAMFYLAKMLEEGDGIPQNKTRAVQFYEQLIELDTLYEVEVKERLAKMKSPEAASGSQNTRCSESFSSHGK